MKTNQGLIFQEKRKVIFRNEPFPDAADNEVVIKTKVTMISTGTELTILEAKEFDENSTWARYGRFPFSPGYNNIGTVVAAGSRKNENLIGKRVATYGFHRQYITADTDGLRLVPEGICDEEAVFFTFADITMQGIRRGCLQWGDVAVIYGAGLIGQMLARFVLFAGARYIFVADISDFRLSLLPENYRLIPVNLNTCDLKPLVSEKTDGRMADVVFEATGNSSLIPLEFAALRVEGRFVLVSSPGGSTLFNFQEYCGTNSYTIIGSHNRSHTPVQTWENPWTQKQHSLFFFELLKNEAIDVKPLVTHQVQYTKAIEMYNMLMADRTKALGVLLDWRL